MATNPFTEPLKLNEPGNVTLRLLGEAGYLWSYKGDLDKALEVFQALTLLAPNDPLPYLGTAETRLTQCKYREADKAAEQASRVPNADRQAMAFAFRIRGKALLQQDKYKDAEKFWQRAAELDPGGPEGTAATDMLRIAREMGILSAEAK